MNITIVRYRLKSESIDGRLYIDGQHICDTAENAQFHIPTGTYPVAIAKCQVRMRNIPVISLTSHPSPLTLCRNCETCALVAEKNEKASMKLINAIHHVMEKGKNEGKPEEEYMAEARALEASLPKLAPRDPMPFCPQIKAGNSAWTETDGAIIVGQYLMPGMVIKSRPFFDALYERIRKNLDRNSEVTITITENYQ